MMKENKNKIISDSISKKRLLESCTMNNESIFKEYQNSLAGLPLEIIASMRAKYGSNEISHKKGASIFKQLYGAFISPFTIILFILATVSLFTDVILANPGEKDYSAVLIITTMVFISGILRFVQEYRSDKSAEKLKNMVKTTISVRRKTNQETQEKRDNLNISQEIPITELVVGDIINLSSGDMIPADCRILQAKDLFVSQSSLTGESAPVEKFSAAMEGAQTNPLDANNLVFMGSNVVSGSAIAMVIVSGDRTIFGSIAQQISDNKKATSFDKGVASVSWVLIRFMLVMVPAVLFINGFTKGDWLEAFMFALSVAVGLTPEMLPMIVSTNLAKGAVMLSRKKVIVKSLNSIQNLGAMNVLCTDKTGTLTQDKVVLIYSLDVHGNQDEGVLRHAFLNSWHQTGLKNLMDIAIINYAEKNEAVVQWKNYTKIDEIPFDFNRRRMSVVVADSSNQEEIITKGAVEEMFAVCSYVEYNGKTEPLTDDLRSEVRKIAEDYNDDGMRVLAIAQKISSSSAGTFSVKDESDMVLIGLLAFLDPPKETAAPAIKILAEYGVTTKILTGDNDAVTKSICKQVGIKIDNILLGKDIENMQDKELAEKVEKTNVFAKLSPQQKVRVVAALRNNGNTVGFMGDGINDAAAMKEADVGISVDSAVDIAKESANIIMLEKSLMVLEEGIIEGRKTYANTIKYIKMTASSNFGNMFSVVVASIFLPFLPMLPLQILMLNLIYDISCTAIPWDNVDEDFLKKPKSWNAMSISKFMVWIGPTSSVFDITTFALLFFYICPLIVGGNFNELNASQQGLFIALFHAGWFVESLWTQTLVIHMIRTPKIPLLQSNSSFILTTFTSLGMLMGTILVYTPLGAKFQMEQLPFIFFPFLLLTIMLYMVLVTVLKKVFIKRYGELL
ncbi:MAG: magnesium-translocating P-type ATPase [Alphaproteobacteria bacterium]|nr:magnesium-translocating P-type ATPase [Alphaproteobacteria bacterium]